MTTKEHELSLIDATEYLPKRRGKPLSVRTLDRWIKAGCRGVMLSAWKRGGRWFTSVEALELFRDGCTNRSVVTTPPLPSANQASAAVRRARATLEGAGFYQ